MRLYISSMFLGNDISLLTDWINSNGNKILLVCNARDHKELNDKELNFRLRNKNMLEEIGFDVEFLDLQEYFNKKDELFKLLNEYKAIFVTGGNVFVLRQAMKLSGLDEYLILNRTREDFLYGGYSAGVCVLSETLKGYDLVDSKINPYDDSTILMDGIGLIDFMVAPHYKSIHKESELVDKMVEFFIYNNIKYVPLKDGDSISKTI